MVGPTIPVYGSVPMRTSTIRNPLHRSCSSPTSLAVAACEPRTTPEATPPAASPANPTVAPRPRPRRLPRPPRRPRRSASTPPAHTAGPMVPPHIDMPATGPAATKFDAHVDREPLLKLGCKVTGDALVCGTPSTAKGDGITCGEYSSPRILLGGLTPKVAITGCDTIGRGLEIKGVYRSGCRLATWHRYVVADGKKLDLIDTKDAFVKRFAPVETPAEALAFAVALTDSKALFKIDLPPNAVVSLKTIDPTSVTPVADGFKVRLYGYQFCGCGPHNFLAIDYLVTRAGEIRGLDSQTALEAIRRPPSSASTDP